MSAHGGGNGPLRPNGRPTVAYALARRKRSDLPDLYRFWGGDDAGAVPREEHQLRARVAEWMLEPERVENRVAALGRRLGPVFERLVSAPRGEASHTELAACKELDGLTSYDMEACLVALQRHALVVEAEDARFAKLGHRVFAVPAELAEGLIERRSKKLGGLAGIMSLHGFLEARGSGGQRPATPTHLRKLYKLYANESAAAGRIDRLPDGVRQLVKKAILEFGGILPKSLFERMETDLPHWNGRRWQKILEESLVGTVTRLDLLPYGIRHDDETLIVFNEVSLAWLKRVAVPGDPDAPAEELSLGIDVISNLTRFLEFIHEHDVRFTVRGEIFKTTEKKIVQYLIPNPGRELSREEVLEFIYRFCRQAGLIDRTGERTLALTHAGREWEQLSLADKLRRLHGYAMHERGLGGEPFHQTRLRELYMRISKRVEPGVWYDLMYLPFLARNTYLAGLGDQGALGYFSERAEQSHGAPMEDPQRLAWNLVRWVRLRLYLLGIVDLGYDAQRRPVAVRLTRSGARLLGMLDDPAPAPGGVGSLVVTPDFEVVLFPTGDDAEVVHALDRFCAREAQGSMLHFKITETSVRRALVQGMALSAIQRTLDGYSRTPVPQNVAFSIHDWAVRAGLLNLGEDLVLESEDPDVIRRVQQDPGARPFIAEVLGESALRLRRGSTPRRLRALLRDLGFVVELA